MLSQDKIKKCAEILKRWGIIIYPTETLYGIGGNPFASGVFERIAQIKADVKKSYILLIKDRQMLFELVENISPFAEKIIERFWPGPLTVIFKAKKVFLKNIAGSDDTIAVRIDAHPVVKALFQWIDFPIISTSANLHGEDAPTKFEQINKRILNQVDGIFVDDDNVKGLPSTIIKFDEKDNPIIIRQGVVAEEDILKIKLTGVKAGRF